MKPIIGIVSHLTRGSGTRGVYSNSFDYIDSVRRGGGVPLLIPECDRLCDIAAAVSRCDGIILPGGDDVHPSFFGERLHPAVRDVYMSLDLFEMEVIREAERQGRPILGICRGVQVINVAFGGTLIQDIPSEAPGAGGHKGPSDARDERLHEIICEEGSIMRRVFGERTWTNSYHHQAVKDVAPDFVVTARATDGIIEAIEHKTKPIFGVQFHPENFSARYDDFAGLFREFANSCKGDRE